MQTPYYAVIFTSKRTDLDLGYVEMSEKMVELAQKQEGFLGIEFARNEIGITVFILELVRSDSALESKFRSHPSTTKWRCQLV